MSSLVHTRSGGRRGRAPHRGSTLIEALVAIAVLGFGTAGIAGLITTVSGANRRLSFQRRANEVFAQFSAQVADAKCDCVGPSCPGVDLDRDPWLDPLVANTFVDPGTACGVPANSTITMCGDQADWVPPQEANGPPLQLSFVVTDGVEDAALTGAPPSFDILVRIREVRYDAGENTIASAPWVREYPLKKVCNLRMEPDGRGEF